MVRIFIILILGLYILGTVEHYLLGMVNLRANNTILGLADFIIIFVLYRNKLQFSGWYKGYRASLSKVTTRVLISMSIILMIISVIPSEGIQRLFT